MLPACASTVSLEVIFVFQCSSQLPKILLCSLSQRGVKMQWTLIYVTLKNWQNASVKGQKYIPSYPVKHRELCKQLKRWYCAQCYCYNIDSQPALCPQRKWGGGGMGDNGDRDKGQIILLLLAHPVFGHGHLECKLSEEKKKLCLVFNGWFYFFFNLLLSWKAGLYQKCWWRPKSWNGSLFYGAWEQQGWEKCC